MTRFVLPLSRLPDLRGLDAIAKYASVGGIVVSGALFGISKICLWSAKKTFHSLNDAQGAELQAKSPGKALALKIAAWAALGLGLLAGASSIALGAGSLALLAGPAVVAVVTVENTIKLLFLSIAGLGAFALYKQVKSAVTSAHQ